MKTIKKSLKQLLIACTALASCSAANAAIVESDYTDWDIFGSASHFEVRFGNSALNGDWEVGTKDGGSPLDTSGQMVWANGVANSFTLSHSAATGELSLMIGAVTMVFDLAANTGYNKISIMAKGFSGGTSTISELSLNGDMLSRDLVSSATKDGLFLTGMLFSDFSLTGNLTFDWNTLPSGSGLEMFVGVTDAEALSEVSAPGTLALGAFGLLGIAAVRRRLRK